MAVASDTLLLSSPVTMCRLYDKCTSDNYKSVKLTCNIDHNNMSDEKGKSEVDSNHCSKDAVHTAVKRKKAHYILYEASIIS